MERFYEERIAQLSAEIDTVSSDLASRLRSGSSLDDAQVQALMARRAHLCEEHDEYKRLANAEREDERQERVREEDYPMTTTSNRRPSSMIAPKMTHHMGPGPTPYRRLGDQLVDVVQAARTGVVPPGLQELNAYQLGLSEAVPSEGGSWYRWTLPRNSYGAPMRRAS